MSARVLLAGAVLLLCGCSEAMPTMAPAKGKVMYRGQPLKFGTVMFQPSSGQSAKGEIKPDGTFELATERYGDGPSESGAPVGTHSVRITCYEGQRPAGLGEGDREPALGKSLIPEFYTNVESSGLKAEVKPDAPPFLFELKDPR
jgi:hypothetical protein